MIGLSTRAKTYFEESISERLNFWATKEQRPSYSALVGEFRRYGRRISQSRACEIANRMGYSLSLYRLQKQERERESSATDVPAIAAALGLAPWALLELHAVSVENYKLENRGRALTRELDRLEKEMRPMRRALESSDHSKTERRGIREALQQHRARKAEIRAELAEIGFYRGRLGWEIDWSHRAPC